MITYFGIQHNNILDNSVADIVFDTRILSDTAHADSVCAIAVQVLDIDVCGIWLWREAVVTNIDPSVAHSQTVDIVRVPTIGILWQILVVRQVLDRHLVKNDVLRGDNEVCPAWRLLEADTLNVQVCGVLCVEKNWSKVGVVCVLRELVTNLG